MTIPYEWRGDFDNAAVNALHAAGFNHRTSDVDWLARVRSHSLGWDSLDDDARYPHTRAPACVRPASRGLLHGRGPHAELAPRPVRVRRASVLLPGQHTELLAAIRAPEGPLHFAGDHTSVKPSWIEGALESGVRAALEVHMA